MSANLVELRQLSLHYGDVLAVDGVDLTLPAGGITALLGRSGCGKTSLLRLVAGFESPSQGVVRIAGRTVAGEGCWVPPECRQVGMVFQEGALFPHMTVWKNVLYGVKGMADDRERARAALARVDMGAYLDRYPDQLSGGQQQRVALARALAPSPRLVLLDEPFASLDAGLRQEVRQQVREVLSQAHMSSILVTHDQEEALSVADRLVVMDRGRILQAGAPSEVYLRPENLDVARFLGDGQLLECEVSGGQARSALGLHPSDVDDGPAVLLVRPEELRLTTPGSDHGESLRASAGVVVSRQFFGHDLIDEVELDSGERLRVRRLAGEGTRLGTRVAVKLRAQAGVVFRRPD